LISPSNDPKQEAARAERNETPTEQLDRNWAELLQEIRVTQTGVQLLTGFLLSLPFQSRFDRITDVQRDVYLAVVVLSLVATALLLAPVSMHRLVFRLHERRALVRVAGIVAQAGLVTLGLALTGVALLIFDVVAGAFAGYLVAGLTFILILGLWLISPLRLRARAVGRSADVAPDRGTRIRP
jgi:O-antigen/teichoic acid export membrane protein